jgi:hypothetical protein
MARRSFPICGEAMNWGLRILHLPLGKEVSMITFQKSLAAAVLTGAVALATPVLVHAQAKAGGSATTSGTVQAPASNGASQAAGANAAGAASESSGQNIAPNSTNATTGAYGGMGSDQSTVNGDMSKAKKKTTTPSNASSPSDTTQPH